MLLFFKELMIAFSGFVHTISDSFNTLPFTEVHTHIAKIGSTIHLSLQLFYGWYGLV